MPLLALPNELLLIIAEDLGKKDLHSFYKTNRHLRNLLTPLFFDDRDPDRMLEWAAANSHETLLRLALYKGADISAQTLENECLDMGRWAVVKYDNAVLELRLKASLDHTCMDAYRMAAIHRAALGGYEEIVRILLEHGAEISARTSRGDTVLHCASSSGHEAVVRLLLERGASIHKQGWRGCTALHFAAMQGDENMVGILLESGANIDVGNMHRATALQMAAWRGHSQTVQLLLEKGANISAQDDLGSTALHLAAENGHKEVVKVLLEGGADLRARNTSGKTAFSVAYANRHKDIAYNTLRTRSKRWAILDWIWLAT